MELTTYHVFFSARFPQRIRTAGDVPGCGTGPATKMGLTAAGWFRMENPIQMDVVSDG